MDANLSKINRCFRLVLGIILMAWAIAGGPAWSLGGIYFLITGAWGFCPFHAAIAALFRKETQIKKAVF
jgi:hypothetical protein